MKTLLSVLALAPALFAMPFFEAPLYDKRELTPEYLRSNTAVAEEDFATSIKRRNYFKDRLIFQLGWGSRGGSFGDKEKQLAQGALGLTTEYITRWNVSAFVTLGHIFKTADPSFEERADLGGGTAWKVGMSYYAFPKYALHPGFSLSYGTVTHSNYSENEAVVAGLVNQDQDLAGQVRPILKQTGVEASAFISYFTNEWYYLNFSVGYTHALNDETTVFDPQRGKDVVLGDEEIDTNNITVGFSVGWALPDMFPDQTERRRRERAAARGNSKYYY